MDVLTSTLGTGLLIAGVITGLASLLAGVWFSGRYFGQPLGALVVQTFGLPASGPGTLRNEKEAAALEAHVSRMLGGLFALMLCIVALLVETVAQEGRNQRGTETRSAWTITMVLVSKGCLEGMVALGALAAVVRVLRLA